jgi:hypothetical protein
MQFSLSTNEMTQLADMNLGRMNHSLIHFNQNIFVVGGKLNLKDKEGTD